MYVLLQLTMGNPKQFRELVYAAYTGDELNDII